MFIEGPFASKGYLGEAGSEPRNQTDCCDLYIGWTAAAICRTDQDWWHASTKFVEVAMIEGSFDARTLAYMNVALHRVCERAPLGEQHDVRERVAQGIIRSAKSGRTTLGALIEGGERALARIPENPKKSA